MNDVTHSSLLKDAELIPHTARAAINRIKKKLHNIILFKGKSGMGKTTSAMAWCSYVDPSFETDIMLHGIGCRLATDIYEFLLLIRSPTLPMGFAVIFDEGGVGASAKNAMSEDNKDFEDILKIIRVKRLNICITTQYTTFFTKQGRMLLDGVFKVVKRREPFCVLKAKWTDYNDELDRDFPKFTKAKIGTRKKIAARTLWLPKPRPEIMQAYKEFEFNDKQALLEEKIAKFATRKGDDVKNDSRPNTVCTQCFYAYKRKDDLKIPRECPNCLRRNMLKGLNLNRSEEPVNPKTS